MNASRLAATVQKRNGLYHVTVKYDVKGRTYGYSTYLPVAKYSEAAAVNRAKGAVKDYLKTKGV